MADFKNPSRVKEFQEQGEVEVIKGELISAS